MRNRQLLGGEEEEEEEEDQEGRGLVSSVEVCACALQYSTEPQSCVLVFTCRRDNSKTEEVFPYLQRRNNFRRKARNSY